MARIRFKSAKRKAIKEIYRLFRGHDSLPAQVVLSVPGSRKTIREVRDLLGITSVKFNGRWQWTAPTEPMEQALSGLRDLDPRSSFHRQTDPDSTSYVPPKKNLACPGPISSLLSLMKDEGDFGKYDHLASYILSPGGIGYSRISAHRAKKYLHIQSIKHGDGWHWIYPAREVQLWIDKKIGQTYYPLAYILAEGREEFNWSEDVIRFSAKELGGIQEKLLMYNDHIMPCWYNMNRWSPMTIHSEVR